MDANGCHKCRWHGTDNCYHDLISTASKILLGGCDGFADIPAGFHPGKTGGIEKGVDTHDRP